MKMLQTGFKKIYVSPADIEKSRKAGFEGEIVGIGSIHQLISEIFS